MSVYQVEEYYVYKEVPEEKVNEVKTALDNCDLIVSSGVSWCDDGVTIEPFDCENYAQSVDDLINSIIED